MTLNMFNKYQVVFVIINIFFMCYIDLIYANDQIIKVHSTYQSINVLAKTISFKTDVILEYKKIKLYADNIVITHDYNMRTISMLRASGNPVTLNCLLESGKIIAAQSLVIYYDTINNIIKFSGSARIEQSGNSIESDDIIYLINQKKIQAISKEKGKTITILLM